MKGILRSSLITLAALYLTASQIKGFTYEGGMYTLLLGAGALMGINWFVKPIAKLLMLPFNLLTLGLFSWIVNVLMVLLLTKVVPQIHINSWYFTGVSVGGYTLPSLNLSVVMTFIVASLVITLIINFLNWLTH